MTDQRHQRSDVLGVRRRGVGHATATADPVRIKREVAEFEAHLRGGHLPESESPKISMVAWFTLSILKMTAGEVNATCT